MVKFRTAVGAHVAIQVLGKLQHRQIQSQGFGQFARGAQVLKLNFRFGAGLELTCDNPFAVLAQYGRIRESADKRFVHSRRISATGFDQQQRFRHRIDGDADDGLIGKLGQLP